ncbi:MAG: glycosyltransferase, partial [Pseudomonas sp.]|nr:glycosyltransferase [Pseudomonas sp.]
MQAAVIVLGDLGRSPRMQYHALALAVNGVDVDLIGEEGAPLPARLQHPRIRVHRLKARRGLAGIAGSTLALVGACRRVRRPDVIVAQTPPAIPTVMVAWAVARLRGSRLVLDWHNLGWTILAGEYGAGHP